MPTTKLRRRARSVADALRVSPGVRDGWFEVGSREDYSSDVSKVNVPVAVIAGEADKVDPLDAVKAKKEGRDEQQEGLSRRQRSRRATGRKRVSDDLPKLGQVSTTRVDNLQVRSVRAGATTGIPVLLTNPWPESIYAFRGLLPTIEGRHPVIAVDLPGFGRSEGRPDVMSPESMGRFIVKLAEHFGMNRLHAVGPDVGTSALLFAAAQKPTLFESLTSLV